MKIVKETKPIIYTYTTEDGITFDFQVIRKNQRNVSIILEETHKIYNITKEEFAKATIKNTEDTEDAE